MPARQGPPRSRRERPAKPALTRAGIVATAVQVMRAEGLERVTTRRLAQELDTGPASLYVYVRNTAELHAAIFDELLGTVDLSPATAAGDWRDRLVQVLTSYVEMLFEHPGLGHAALQARPSGEHYLDLIDALLSLLAEGGVPGRTAAWAVDLLLQAATAQAAEHAPRTPGTAPSGDWDELASALDAVSADRHPHVAALGAGPLLSGSGPERLRWGLHLLINGILHTPEPAATPAPTAQA